MADNGHPSEPSGWLETSGLVHIFRTLGMAVQPAKLGIALVAIIATLALGGILDTLWTWRPGGGVGEAAITQYIARCEFDQTYHEPEGDRGIFKTFRAYERQCLVGFFQAATLHPDAASASGAACRSLRHMAYGVCWLARHHACFFALFALGSLAIWSLAGGAICRMAAVQFAQGQQLTLAEGLTYARKRFGSFFLTPCVPVVLMVVVALCMALGGLLLRVWLVGDIICGLAFVLAILGGFVIAALMVGLVVGGSLFWPTVATEGTDAFDTFGRSLPYAFFKPWKTVFYALVALVYAAICWMFVYFFTYLTLSITHAVVSFGTSPFGWFSLGDEADPISKLELLWRLDGPNQLHAFPQDWAALGWFDCIAAGLIGLAVLLVIGLMWSFLASFYYSGSTVIYFLLRRDVDGTDLDEICAEEGAGKPEAFEAPKPEQTPAAEPAPPSTPEEPTPVAEKPTPTPEPPAENSDTKESPPT